MSYDKVVVATHLLSKIPMLAMIGHAFARLMVAYRRVISTVGKPTMRLYPMDVASSLPVSLSYLPSK